MPLKEKQDFVFPDEVNFENHITAIDEGSPSLPQWNFELANGTRSQLEPNTKLLPTELPLTRLHKLIVYFDSISGLLVGLELVAADGQTSYHSTVFDYHKLSHYKEQHIVLEEGEMLCGVKARTFNPAIGVKARKLKYQQTREFSGAMLYDVQFIIGKML